MNRDLHSERCVYLHRDAHGIFYVGMGTWSRAYTRCSRNRDWHNRVAANGGKFEIVIFECGLTIEEAAKIEKDCISYLGRENLVNRSAGGEHSAYGMRHTVEARRKISQNSASRRPEHRAKLSETMRGSNNPMFGKTHNSDARTKISNARSDKKHHVFRYGEIEVRLTRTQFRMVSGATIQQVHHMIRKGGKFKGWKVINA